MATYFARDFNSLQIFVFAFYLFAMRAWGTIVTTMEAATERANAGFPVHRYHYRYHHQGQRRSLKLSL